MRGVGIAALALWLSLWAGTGTGRGGEIEAVRFADSPSPPYVLGEVGRPATGGLAVAAAREVFDRIGVRFSLDLYPWKRVLKMAEEGLADGVTALLHSEQREAYLVFTNALSHSGEIFFHDIC